MCTVLLLTQAVLYVVVVLRSSYTEWSIDSVDSLTISFRSLYAALIFCKIVWEIKFP